jgi:hypothetical protein
MFHVSASITFVFTFVYLTAHEDEVTRHVRDSLTANSTQHRMIVIVNIDIDYEVLSTSARVELVRELRVPYIFIFQGILTVSGLKSSATSVMWNGGSVFPKMRECCYRTLLYLTYEDIYRRTVCLTLHFRFSQQ